MPEFQIQNLKLISLTNDILLAHQIKPPHHFSCCDGLIILPREGRNKQTIILDLNVEPEIIDKLFNYIGPVGSYICSHGHMDHITHVHRWETLGTQIFAPNPEHICLLNLDNFYRNFGFNEQINYNIIQKFANVNKYQNCSVVHPFNPGYEFRFDNLEIKSIPLLGHSKAHVGFLLPQEKVLHISCLGYDLVMPGSDGFGPWYGFEECSIEQYIRDINVVEEIFLDQTKFLTSSHSNIVKNPDTSPFRYMRDKIIKNQRVVDEAIKRLNLKVWSNDALKELLKLDLFFPKRKMKDFMKEIYFFWESGIIKKHFERSENTF